MKYSATTVCVLLLATGIIADPIHKDTYITNGLEDCLTKDSITCLQLSLFRQAKSFFDSPQIELLGGVALKKIDLADSRHGKSIMVNDEDNAIAIETAPTVEARAIEMSSYLWENAKNFFAERSLTFNFADAARSIGRAIPDDIKEDFKDLVVEGRTKKKLLLKKLLPFIIGIGAKVAILAIGSLFGLLFIAKKALIVSIIAFIMAVFASVSAGASGAGGGGGFFGGLGSLFGGGKSSAPVISPGWSSSASNAGWSSGGGSNAGWDSHGAYSANSPQAIAYSGYKQARR